MSLAIPGTIVNSGLSLMKAKGDRKQAAEELRTSLIKGKDSHNHSWEIAALEGEGWELSLIRILSFLVINAGILITLFKPELGSEIWEAYSLVPNWIVGLQVTIFGWAFGSTPVKNAAAGLVGSKLKFDK